MATDTIDWLAGEIIRLEEQMLPLAARRDALRECLDRLTAGTPAAVPAEPDPFAAASVPKPSGRNGARIKPAPDAPDDDEPSLAEELAATPDTVRGRRYGGGPGKPDPNRQSDLAHPWQQETEAAAQERAARVNGHAGRVAVEEPAARKNKCASNKEHQRKAAAYIAEHGPTPRGVLQEECHIPQGSLAKVFRGNDLFASDHGHYDLTPKGRAELLDQADVGDAGLLPVRRQLAALLHQQGTGGLSYPSLQIQSGLKTSELSEALGCEFFTKSGGRFVLTPLGNNVLREE